jgi:hypothetical protein
MRVQVTLFGEHGLALDDPFGAVVLQDLQHDLIVLLGVVSPMHVCAFPRGVRFEFLQIVRQMGKGMQLDLRRQFAQLLPFRHRLGGFVAFRPNKPQRLVMPAGPLAVGDKLGGVVGVIALGQCRHGSNSNNLKLCSRRRMSASGQATASCVSSRG